MSYNQRGYRFLKISFLLCLSASGSYCKSQILPKNEKDSLKILITDSYQKSLFDNHKDILNYSIELYQIAKNNKDQEDILFSLLEQSRIYLMESKFDASLKKIEEGIDLAYKVEDYNMLCRFMLIYQRVLFQLDYVKEGRPIFKRIKNINDLVKNDDERCLNNIYLCLAEADNYVNKEGLSNNMNQIINIKRKALYLSSSLKNNNSFKKFTQIMVLQSLAWSCALAKRIDESQSYLKAAENLLIINPNYYLKIDFLITKAAIENIEKRYEKAIFFLTEAINMSEKSGTIYKLYTIYPMLSVAYGEQSDFYNAMKSAWIGKKLGDELHRFKIKGNNLTIINRINFKITNPVRKTNYNYIFIIMVAVLLSGISLYFVFRKNKKNNNKRQAKFLNELPEKEKSHILDTPIVGCTINSDINLMLIQLAKENINTFYIEFTKYYPEFHFKLKGKYPELNLSDINFCSLIKMKFDIKEIATYTRTTLKSVESRRYRIRKKMHLENQDNLYISIAAVN